MKRLREVVLIVFGTMGILALARQALEPAALEAVAIPNAQEDVDTDLQSFGSTGFVLVPNSIVRINNGTQTRRVIIQFSADARLGDVSGADAIQLGYALNNGGGSVCFPQAGPLFFATNPSVWQTHTAIHVPTLGPGRWTIQPCVRIRDGNGDDDHVGELAIRTLTAEVMTK